MLFRAFITSLAVMAAASNGFAGETRFGRQVVKLAADQQFTYVTLDGNLFPVETRGGIAVSCMTYKDNQRYYVEVAVSNQSAQALTLSKGFVGFEKLGYTVFMTNTLSSSAELRGSVAGPFIPTPPPTDTTTTVRGTAITTGNVTTLQASAHTTDNSGWYRLGQAIAARRYYKTQSREQAFATYLETFANELQPLEIEPNSIQLYVFTFQQLRRKKEPFTIRVRIGTQEFPFSYSE